jgi:hypothetical protein
MIFIFVGDFADNVKNDDPVLSGKVEMSQELFAVSAHSEPSVASNISILPYLLAL